MLVTEHQLVDAIRLHKGNSGLAELMFLAMIYH